MSIRRRYGIIIVSCCINHAVTARCAVNSSFCHFNDKVMLLQPATESQAARRFAGDRLTAGKSCIHRPQSPPVCPSP